MSVKLQVGWILLGVLLLSGCTLGIVGTPAGTPPGTPTVNLPANLPDVQRAARAYLDAWKQEDYPAMYAMLTSISQAAISEEKFIEHYQGVAAEAALSGVDYQLLTSLTNPDQAQVSYRINLDSSLVGQVQADTAMNLSLEGGKWRVQWDDSLVLPQLKGSNYLSMDTQGYKPSRGNIYDRNGHALVAQADAVAIGLYPDQIDPAQAEFLYTQLSELTGLRGETIQAMHANFPAGAGWYLPLGEVTADEVTSRYEALNGLRGLSLSSYKSRYYFDGGVAAHVLGYMGEIPAEQQSEYLRQGYQIGDRIGLSGLEKWGESVLSGQRGGALYVRNSSGQPVTILAEKTAKPAQAIYTTLDRDFQEGVQQAISGFRAAVVVIERDTGRVLAMASSPDFDPNAFEPVNYNSGVLQANLDSPDQPLFNRASQGQYPLGSVFKIITMAAALESGEYSSGSTYYCGKTFTELQGVTLYDWTNDYDFPASGNLTLPGGLIRSCNPWFYHIGLDLFNRGMGNLVTEMAGGFGLGKPTGIVGVDEVAGQVPEPESQSDATNQSIGQGALLVTPLQVANFVAAIGNGGTLYQPQLIERIVPLDGQPEQIFQPKVLGQLPVSAEVLEVIQQAMVGVVSSTQPRGTAYHVFTGLEFPVAGKTGTAQTGISAPHAWFAGYTFAEQADHPDIAVAVVMENAGEGSDYAAPVFRRIVELYFRGIPGKLYDWESIYNVTATPEP